MAFVVAVRSIGRWPKTANLNYIHLNILSLFSNNEMNSNLLLLTFFFSMNITNNNLSNDLMIK